MAIDVKTELRDEIAKRRKKYGLAKESLPTDPWQFATQCLETIDEASAGTEPVIKPFPQYPHLEVLIRTIAAEKAVRIDKSGQILVSWGCIAYFLHQVLTVRGYRMAYYCMTMTKAQEHIESRFYRMYLSIPATYKKPYAKMLDGQFLVYHDGPDKPPTSWIMPQATEQGKQDEAADKMRSMTWTAALVDEAAFPKNLKELLGSLMPRCGKIVEPSTPNGKNHFHRQGFGNVMDEREKAVEFNQLDAKQVMKGVWTWRRNDFLHLRIHYSAHPHRDPSTPEGREWMVRSGVNRMDRNLWAREQEISYEVAAGQPVYNTLPRIVDGREVGGLIVRPQTFDPGLYLWRGWDFGYRFPFCVFAQVRPFYKKDGTFLRDRLHVLYEFTLPDSSTDQMAEAVKAVTDDLFPNAVVKDCVDFYGGNQRTSHNPKTDVEILNDHGITAMCNAAQVKMGVEIGQKLLLQGDLEVDPNCSHFITGMQSGYVRGDDGELPSEIEKSRMHPYCDCLDGFRYITQQVFHFGRQHVKSVHRPFNLTNPTPSSLRILPRPDRIPPTKYTNTVYRPGRGAA